MNEDNRMMHNIVPARFTIMELVDITIALQNTIKECDEMIEGRISLGMDTSLWTEKRERVIKSMEKLTYKY